MEKLVKQAIAQYDLIRRGDQVIVGLSGGPDSLCLFSVLHTLSAELDFALSAVHVNHGLRGAESDADQEYVERLCRQMEVPCCVYRRDCAALAAQAKLTCEEAGRKARYEAFADAAEHVAATGWGRSKIRIAVAHNAQDQAETLLLHILRGTGTDGLAGMEPARQTAEGMWIIRPLLAVSRVDIEGYCREKHLQPRRDQTNEQTVFVRNRIRLELLPLLAQEYNPRITDALLRLAAAAAEDRAFLRKTADRALADCRVEKAEPHSEGVETLDLKKLQALEPAIRHRVIKAAFCGIGLQQDITAVHIAAADRLIEVGQTSARADFPHGYTVEISYDTVRLRKPLSSKAEQHAREHRKDRRSAPPCLSESPAENAQNQGEAPMLPAGWAIRTRLPGDYLRLSGSAGPRTGGRKKLQDFFVDRKVPRELRDRVLLLCHGHEVVKIGFDFKTGQIMEISELTAIPILC